MTGFTQEQIDIEALFHATWDSLSPAIPVVHDNESYDPTSSDVTEWVRLVIRPGDAEKKTIATVNSKYRYKGVVFLQVFTRDGVGTGRANEIADIFSAIFRDRIYSNIHFSVPAVTRVGNSNGWFQTNLDCGYYREDI